MSNIAEIKVILGEPDKTYDDSLNNRRSHWWVDRTQKDFDKVEPFGAIRCPAGSALIQGRIFDINYVENKTFYENK